MHLPIATEVGANSKASPTPEPDKVPGSISYVISAEYRHPAQIIYVSENIRYTNMASLPLQEIVLAVQPARVPDSFTLSGALIDGSPPAKITQSGQRLEFRLSELLLPGRTIQISLAYSLTLPAINEKEAQPDLPRFYGVYPRQINLADWYPMVVPFDETQGWLLPDPYPQGEHLVYPLADFLITLKLTGWDNAQVVLAPAGELHQVSTDRWEVTSHAARNVVLSISTHYEHVSALADDVLVTSYYFPEHQKAGQAALNVTLQALSLYGELFGKYPHTNLAVVEGDYNDGMEYDGLYFLSNAFYENYDGSPYNFLTLISAHETCHQWWYGKVANDQANHPWLDESISTYCEQLYLERYYPGALPWWWDTRIRAYHPTGFIDRPVSSFTSFTPYVNTIYRRGAMFYQELRDAIGDDIFFAFLKDYLTRMNGKIASEEDFFQILKGHTDQDLSPLLKSYFQNSPTK